MRPFQKYYPLTCALTTTPLNLLIPDASFPEILSTHLRSNDHIVHTRCVLSSNTIHYPLIRSRLYVEPATLLIPNDLVNFSCDGLSVIVTADSFSLFVGSDFHLPRRSF
jgi:hypothetical protein